jgi:hypothetical protein
VVYSSLFCRLGKGLEDARRDKRTKGGERDTKPDNNKKPKGREVNIEPAINKKHYWQGQEWMRKPSYSNHIQLLGLFAHHGLAYSISGRSLLRSPIVGTIIVSIIIVSSL